MQTSFIILTATKSKSKTIFCNLKGGPNSIPEKKVNTREDVFAMRACRYSIHWSTFKWVLHKTQKTFMLFVLVCPIHFMIVVYKYKSEVSVQ